MQTLSCNLSYVFLTGKFLQIVGLTKIRKTNFMTNGQAENRSLGWKHEFVLESLCWEFYSDTKSIAFVVVIDLVVES